MNRIERLADGIELYLGDCRDVLPTIGPVDAMISDPPYGVGLEYGVFKDTPENVKALSDVFIPWGVANTKFMLITPGHYFYFYPRPDWTMAWVTPAGASHGPYGYICWQPILVYGKCPYLANGLGAKHDVIIHTEQSEINGHPCPKPIVFMEKLVDRGSLPGWTIVDPFLGSGTTGVAAINTGRRFIGIELDPIYFDIACKRIDKALKRPTLFTNKPRAINPREELF